MILPNCTLAAANQIAERVRRCVEQHEFVLLEGDILHLTISIGVSAYLDFQSDAQDTIQVADDGLYLAKHRGRNQVGLVG